MSPRLGFRSAMPWLSINPSLSAEIWYEPSLEVVLSLKWAKYVGGTWSQIVPVELKQPMYIYGSGRRRRGTRNPQNAGAFSLKDFKYSFNPAEFNALQIDKTHPDSKAPKKPTGKAVLTVDDFSEPGSTPRWTWMTRANADEGKLRALCSHYGWPGGKCRTLIIVKAEV
ncbi:hypothetical protein B0H14DRAFT_2654122 [Mycena olivaceomarginata]|nr:hypothetical protein B0H14DRAFT_2654122 [Mycena olivaceomarginata]